MSLRIGDVAPDFNVETTWGKIKFHEWLGDEATNALDSNNEAIILKNLREFLSERTVVVVAHRLSTIQNADQIIVLENGEVIESGAHDYLIKKKGAYCHLVNKQFQFNVQH